jgi:type II secretory pathway pseudopilin PulG
MRSGLRNERGATYLMLMCAIVLIGLVTSVAAKQWKMMVQRELEADLLARGIEIQQALALYSTTMKAGRVMQEVYPQSLADLTRLPKPFLRKVYLDPMGHGEWDYLRSPTGGIMGVKSRSKAKPIRQHEFPPEVRHFEGRKKYDEWVFQYPNPSTTSLIPPVPQGTMPAPSVPSPQLQPGGPSIPTPTSPPIQGQTGMSS